MTILSKEQHVVVYVDFSKAFDVVSHPKLFARLYSYGIRDTLLNWLIKFFTGCMHCTKVGTAMSDAVLLTSGVVQGSGCLLYTSPSPRDRQKSRMPSSA